VLRLVLVTPFPNANPAACGQHRTHDPGQPVLIDIAHGLRRYVRVQIQRSAKSRGPGAAMVQTEWRRESGCATSLGADFRPKSDSDERVWLCPVMLSVAGRGAALVRSRLSGPASISHRAF
jgi:hypothetical protein